MISKWASKWRQLGTLLKIDQRVMDNIEHDHPNDCERCCGKMLSEWLDITPAASWEDIINAADSLSSDGMLSYSIYYLRITVPALLIMVLIFHYCIVGYFRRILFLDILNEETFFCEI